VALATQIKEENRSPSSDIKSSGSFAQNPFKQNRPGLIDLACFGSKGVAYALGGVSGDPFS
jgi:hypothetical protein